MKFLRIELPYAVAGIEVDNGIVVRTAPIFRWMIGKTEQYIRAWVRRKLGEVTP